MRAIRFAGPRKIEFVDVPIPQPKEGEVLVRCTHVGLCGTNMGQYTGDGLWAEKFPNPVGLGGPRDIGVIVESRIKGWTPDALVLAQPEGYFGFAEYFVARPPGIALLPRNAPDVASLIVAQPLATVLRALDHTASVINQRCAVIGAGPMGLIWTYMLHQFGARQVITTDLLAWRLEWAKRYGAQVTLDASKQDVPQVVRDLTGGEKLDFVVTAATTPESLTTAARLVKRGGRLFTFGMPDHAEQMFPWFETIMNETQIVATLGPECAAFFQIAADMMVDGRASELGKMVTPRMPWAQAAEAFEMYANCTKDSLKLTLEL